MNLFARILSHGFALVLVALLVIGLLYRGELFPGLELPDFPDLISGNGEDESDDRVAGVMPAPEQAAAPESAGISDEPGQDDQSMQVPEEPSRTEALFAPAEPAPEVAEPDTGSEQAAAAEQEGTVPPGPRDAGPGEQVMMYTESQQPIEPEPEPEAPAFIEAPPIEPEPEPESPAFIEAAPVTEPEPAAEADVLSEVPPPAAEEPAAGAGPLAEPEPSAPDVGQPEAAIMEPPAQAAMMEAEEPDAATAAAAEPPAESAVAETAVEVAPAGTVEAGAGAQDVSAYRLLAAAREAYWLRDYDAAEKSYQALIALEPDNPDGYGELGNMYFSRGEWQQASAAYYEAGVRLVDQGLTDHAARLVEVIRGLDGKQAEDLDEKISAARSGASN